MLTSLTHGVCVSTVSPQGVVPVGHQLPGGEAQRPGGLGDQAGDGTRKQLAGGDVPEERLLHRVTVGSKAHRSPLFCFCFVFFVTLAVAVSC